MFPILLNQTHPLPPPKRGVTYRKLPSWEGAGGGLKVLDIYLNSLKTRKEIWRVLDVRFYSQYPTSKTRQTEHETCNL